VQTQIMMMMMMMIKFWKENSNLPGTPAKTPIRHFPVIKVRYWF